MKKPLLLSLLAGMALSTGTFAYDAEKAKQLEHFYSHMTQKACADSKLFLKAEDVMKMFREKKPFVLLDVRTKGENAIVSISSENAMHIPVESVFKAENLDKLPTDRPVIVVCHSGTRATMAVMGLKQVGFKNIQVLKGGFVALADATNTKNAPLK